MIFSVAITGSIASGKSTALKFFADKGLSIISADEINRALLQPDTTTFSAIVDHFGSQVLTANHQLNKNALRQIIFNHPDEKAWLEKLLHPAIRNEIVSQLEKAQGDYAIIEIPLLSHKKDYPYLNRILLIDIEASLQLRRLMQRDHCTLDEAKAAVKSHIPSAIHRSIADDIVLNNHDQDQLFAQLEAVHQKYLRLSRQA